MRVTATTGNSPTYIYPFYQTIEANNIIDLNWGSAYGASVTVSFWFRSNMAAGSTGSFSIRNANAGSAWALYNNTFTVVGGGAWQYVVITIPPPTTGTTWYTGANAGIEFLALAYFAPVSGTIGWSTSGQTGANQTTWFTTTGNYIEITGVQFEKGLTASPYEFLPIGTELALCQRYYEKSFNQGVTPANGATDDGSRYIGSSWSTNNIQIQIQFKVPKRPGIGTAGITFYNSSNTGTGGAWALYNGGWVAFTPGTPSVNENYITLSASPTATFGQSYLCTGFWTASAEF
jgi:hypothetical protein